MQKTGIVRRIDDLGRVVIPKEIRRSIGIREGDALEIFVNGDGVLFKKYSPIKCLNNDASRYAKAISNGTSCSAVIITDTDCIIAVSGLAKGITLNAAIDEFLKEIIYDRKEVSIQESHFKDKDQSSMFVCPIVSQGEAMGAAILISDNPISDANKAATRAIVSAIKLQLEE